MVAIAGAAASNAQTAAKSKLFFVTDAECIFIPFRLKNSSQQSRASMTPGKNAALIAPRKHEKSQSHYHHRYMMTRAILAKVCRCKPNRRSRGYPDFKQGSKLLKVNYFPSGCIGVGFSTSPILDAICPGRRNVFTKSASPQTFIPGNRLNHFPAGM